jgi:serine/threonine protein kinase
MPLCSKCGYDNLERSASCAICDSDLTSTGSSPAKGDSDVTDARSLIGKVLNGKYKVLSLLGEGGMGVVYKVQHLILQNKNIFALKILRSRFSTDDEFQTRFMREVEVTMELTHENIIQIRDFGMTETGLLFFTMDYFPGRSLKSIIEENGILPTSRVVSILRQVALALREAHRAMVIHRDLKPDNILVEVLENGRERVRVLDFGIAKILENDDTAGGLTQGNLLGTPKYMAPEQVSGERTDTRADLYALGIIVYEMLVGRVPFATGTTRTMLMNHITATPPPFSVIRPDLEVPLALENLVFALLEKEPDARPADADAILEVLRTDATVRQTPPVGLIRRRKRARLAVAAVVIFAAGLTLEHFIPWRQFLLPKVAAEQAPTKVPLTLPSEPVKTFVKPDSKSASPRTAAVKKAVQAPSGASDATPVKLRCDVCGGEFRRGEKVSGMCHGLPLSPAL